MIGVSYNTQAIKTDVNGKPIPQYFNAQQDQYEALLGQDGAARAILYGPDGQPIGTSGNPLQVKAQDTDDVLEQIKTALEALATEDKLEAVRLLLQTLDGKAATSQGQADIIEAIGTLAGLVATESGQTAIASAITSLAQAVATETTLDDVKTAAETLAGTVDNGAAKVTLQGSLPPSMMELAVNDWSELPDPTETPKGATAQLIGTFDVRQNNGAEWVEVVL